MKHAFLIIAAFAMLLAAPARATTPAPFDVKKAQKLLDSITADAAVPGAVLYIKTPDGVWSVTSGYSNRETKKPISADDGFYIASLSKMLTAVVTYKLAEEGKIELDAPISDYIDETFKGELENFYDATIDQVLWHKDGMVDYLPQGYYEMAAGWPDFDASDPRDAAMLAVGKPALFAPGKKYAYGSTGYVLLGLMMTTITGEDIQTVFDKRLFKPIGLAHTMFGVHPAPEWMARGYLDTESNVAADCGEAAHCVQDVTEIDWGDKLTDGGIISTAADMDKFLRALLADKTLLKPDSLDKMLTATELMPDEEAAHGITIFENPYGRAIGHMGSYPGYRSVALYLPERDMTLVFWTNGMFDMETVFMDHIGDFLGAYHPAEE